MGRLLMDAWNGLWESRVGSVLFFVLVGLLLLGFCAAPDFLMR